MGKIELLLAFLAVTFSALAVIQLFDGQTRDVIPSAVVAVISAAIYGWVRAR